MTDPTTPTALILAATSFALDRLIVFLRRRKRSKWNRLEKAIAIGVNAAWLSYVRPIKIARNHPDNHLTNVEIKEAHHIALSAAQAHANITCPKIWRSLSDAEKAFLIDQALRQRKQFQTQNPTRDKTDPS